MTGRRRSAASTSVAMTTVRVEIGAPTFCERIETTNGKGRVIAERRSMRRLARSESAFTHARSCGTRRIAEKVMSMMKRKSQAGRDQLSGDQIIVPKLVTRSSKMWLKMPTAYSAASGKKDGASHLRERASHWVNTARSKAHS